MRSLVGAFALRNFARFHAGDGKGYAFAADQVARRSTRRTLQPADGLRRRISLWKRFAQPRRGLMRPSALRNTGYRRTSPRW